MAPPASFPRPLEALLKEGLPPVPQRRPVVMSRSPKLLVHDYLTTGDAKKDLIGHVGGFGVPAAAAGWLLLATPQGLIAGALIGAAVGVARGGRIAAVTAERQAAVFAAQQVAQGQRYVGQQALGFVQGLLKPPPQRR